MTFFLTFHDPLHNVPRSISAARLSTLFGAFSTPLLLSPLYARLFVRFLRRITPAFPPALYTYEAPRDRGNRGGTRDFRLSQKSELPANSEYLPSPLERARIYSKRTLIFQRKPSVLLQAER